MFDIHVRVSTIGDANGGVNGWFAMSFDFTKFVGFMGSWGSWAPFTEDTIAKYLRDYGDRISHLITDGCEDCEIMEHCCGECYDDKMMDKMKALVTMMRSYRKRMMEADDDPVKAMMNQIKNGGE